VATVSDRPSFRQALAAEHPLILFGAFDGLSARLIERAGCKAAFVSGFSVVGARYGVPDLGLRAFGDIAAAVGDILNATGLPLLVDADDGYGDVKNAVHTVQTYERVGVSALMIEDQTWPKRCGHMAGKSVVPVGQMAAKIRAVSGEKLSPDTFIIARTDARTVEGLDAALRRAERYLEAGADGLFIEAPESVDELAKIGRTFDVPLLANPLEGGKSPILSPKEYGELGFGMIGYGITLLLRVAGIMETAMDDIRSGRFQQWDSGMSFERLKDVLDLPGWSRIEETYRAE
jgi:2-methylisocitrate lyase-like PEP mutase family enzyme